MAILTVTVPYSKQHREAVFRNSGERLPLAQEFKITYDPKKLTLEQRALLIQLNLWDSDSPALSINGGHDLVEQVASADQMQLLTVVLERAREQKTLKMGGTFLLD